MTLQLSLTPADAASASSASLPDVQQGQDTRGIALHAAGVRHVEMPLLVGQRSGDSQRVTATANLSVGLSAHEKGTHMSRFIVELAEWGQHKTLSPNLAPLLAAVQARLEAPAAYAELAFTYFMDKPAPVTQAVAPCGYAVRLKGNLNATGCDLFARIEVPMATCCPCSKAISDFGAHNQRAIYTIDLYLDPAHAETLFIEDIVDLADASASCAVYPLLKRADEKWVTERQYENPKFVEDVCRDLSLALRNHPAVKGFMVTAEALESIHPHNAWACYHEAYPFHLAHPSLPLS